MSAGLTTERLSLRGPIEADAPRIAELVGDLRVSSWVTHVPHPYSVEDGLDFIARFAAPEKRTYLVCHDGTVIGCMGLAAELGYWFGVDHWGRGFATEAAQAVLADHFATSATPVKSGYHLGNARSANVLTKLGFAKTGGQRDVTVAATGKIATIQEMRLTSAARRVAA